MAGISVANLRKILVAISVLQILEKRGKRNLSQLMIYAKISLSTTPWNIFAPPVKCKLSPKVFFLHFLKWIVCILLNDQGRRRPICVNPTTHSPWSGSSIRNSRCGPEGEKKKYQRSFFSHPSRARAKIECHEFLERKGEKYIYSSYCSVLAESKAKRGILPKRNIKKKSESKGKTYRSSGKPKIVFAQHGESTTGGGKKKSTLQTLQYKLT